MAMKRKFKVTVDGEIFIVEVEDIVEKVLRHHIENGGISRYKKIRHYYQEFLRTPISEEKVNEIAEKFSDLVVEKVIASDSVKGAKEFLEKYFHLLVRTKSMLN